jgi:hypothetical protein
VRAIGKVVRSPVGKALGGVLKMVAKTALPMEGQPLACTTLIAADEVRHAQSASELVARRIRADRKVIERKLEACAGCARALTFWLAPAILLLN